MATAQWQLETPKWFRFSTVVFSHGWFHLPPFEWQEASRTLKAVGRLGSSPVTLEIRERKRGKLEVEAQIRGRWTEAKRDAVLSLVAEMLGLSIDVAEFYRQAGPDFEWARKLGAGPFLRSATAFEDVVKMLATTNCSWSLTHQMVTRLVEHLGDTAPGGIRAFPTPEAMAGQPVEFFRDTIRTGYRAAYFQKLAREVAEGRLDLERWPRWEGSTEDLVKQMRLVPGLGRYSAENLCKLFGRYDGLGIDSWCIKKYPLVHGKVRGDVERAIRKRYARHGRWQGLALWLDLTKDWHEKHPGNDGTVVFQKP